MGHVNLDTLVSPEDYLAFEDNLSREDGKHEYVDGRIDLMIGASFAHATIVANILSECRQVLKTTPYRAYASDIRVSIESANCYYYPDISICLVGSPAEANTTDAPIVVIEVLSPSTRQKDRTEKLGNYKRLPSLQKILLVEQDVRQVEVHRRSEAGWIGETIRDEESVTLRSVGASVPLTDIYAGMEDLT